jgi:ankyrin repeat protein
MYDGWTGLSYTVYTGDEDSARLLIENKAEVNAASKVLIRFKLIGSF